MLLSKIFSKKYVNHNAVQNNIILLLMYRGAYPFAVSLNKLHFSPNVITSLSIAFSIAAFLSLILYNSWVPYTVFWSVSVLLDFCDGTVARMANKVSKTSFRYDHMSDLFKLSLVIMGAAIHYNELLLWVLSTTTIFMFLFYSVLNQELGWVTKLNKVKSGSQGDSNTRENHVHSDHADNKKYQLARFLYKNIRSVMLTINGHTLLFFYLLPFGGNYAVFFMMYIAIVSGIGIKIRIKRLLNIER